MANREYPHTPPRGFLSSPALHGSYAMAKRAQVTLTERWAALHKNICINSMHPGWCDTPGLSAGMPDFHKAQQGTLRSSDGGSDTIVWLVRGISVVAVTKYALHARLEAQREVALHGTDSQCEPSRKKKL